MPLKEKSVHLADWPSVVPKLKTQNSKLLREMETVRRVVARALKLRADAGIKVRQPLQTLAIDEKLPKDLSVFVMDEVNVKDVVSDVEMRLDTTITPELREEGMAREFVRTIQDMRRDMGLRPQKAVRIQIAGSEMLEAIFTRWQDAIKKDTNARELKVGGKKIFKIERELELDGQKIWIGIV